MKTWKLVAGILSIVFVLAVFFQSCAAGIVNAVEDNGGSSGTVGFFVGILMLAGGIVSICVRKSKEKGGNIALIILFGLATIIGYVGHDNYKDLVVWSTWCLINAVLALICLFKKNNESEGNISQDGIL